MIVSIGILTVGVLAIGALVAAANEMSGCYYTHNDTVRQLTSNNNCGCCNKGCESNKCCSKITCEENSTCSCVKYNAFDILGKFVKAGLDIVEDGADFLQKFLQIIVKYWWVFLILIFLLIGVKLYSNRSKN